MNSVSSNHWSRRKMLLAGCAALGGRRGVLAADDLPHVRILFLGNSYTAQNRLPAAVGEIILSSKLLAPHIGSYLQGGHKLEQHATDKDALNLLKQGADGQPWDVVVVQEQSVLSAMAAVNPEARKLMSGGLSKLVAAARAVNPKVLIVDFQIWARHESLWQKQNKEALLTGRDPGQAHARIRQANVNAVNDALKQHPNAGILVSPVGDFWKLALEAYPALPLHSEDGTHPDKLGTLLAGLVIAGTIGGREVIENSTWLGDCPFSQVAKVKKVLLDHPQVFKEAGK
ncbi:MAG: hypothetical protein ACO1TE_02950 [Prosthecobacter sp.]